jgi:hypothetical protein
MLILIIFRHGQFVSGLPINEIFLDSNTTAGPDTKSTRPLLGVYPGITASTCALLCKPDEYCGGINFFRIGGDLGDCQLVYGKDDDSFATAPGSTYYENTVFGLYLNAKLMRK